MAKKNTSKKTTFQNSVEVIWDNIHPNVKQAMRNVKVNGVHGIVSDCTKERVEVTFTHNNEADKCNHKFWFDFDQVIIFPATAN